MRSVSQAPRRGRRATRRSRTGNRADRRHLQAGELIGERYRIHRFLARGGMGEVYEALDTWLNEKVARRRSSRDRGQSIGARSVQGRSEADPEHLPREHLPRVRRRVPHEGAAKGRREPEHSLPDDGACSTAQRCARTWAKTGPLGRVTMLPIARGIVLALANAHAAGVVHRDFKSDNVIVVGSDRDGHAATPIPDPKEKFSPGALEEPDH